MRGWMRCFVWCPLFCVISLVSYADQSPWPAEVADYVAPLPGEHPRLLFRESDLPRLRSLAQTPEGQAILTRLRQCLNGSDGESLPSVFNPVIGPAPADGTGDFHATAPLGSYTFSHMAGYGLLYQITGDVRYATLAKQCFDLAQMGYRDRDRRYAFLQPYGALRTGPVLGWTAIAYDLCYDAWDEDTRRKVAHALAKYAESEKATLDNLAVGTMPPFSNHFGMQVGGAALALMAIKDSPWVDHQRIETLLQLNEESMIRNLTEGFGDGGFYAEGDGTGSMASHIIFLTALQAWKNAQGKDFISPRPNAPMTTLKWIYQTILHSGRIEMWPIRGAYPHNVWQRNDKSGAGYFAIGFGALTRPQKQAMLWFYNENVHETDGANGTPYDTVSPYPHLAVSAFVNWPWELEPRNPSAVLPNAYRDSTYGFYAFRNRWQDENDIVITLQTRDARGYHRSPADGLVYIRAFGGRQTTGTLRGPEREWITHDNGSSILALKDGSWLVVDFSGTSGAAGLVVATGPSIEGGTIVSLEGQAIHLFFLDENPPPPIYAIGNEIRIGEQIITWDKNRLSLKTIP